MLREGWASGVIFGAETVGSVDGTLVAEAAFGAPIAIAAARIV
jgi:hypothetical protein